MARTQATLDTLVAVLQQNCGDLYAACRSTGVSLIFVRAWMKDDKDVAAQLVEAERVGAMALQTEAIRRAVIGEEKGVYFKGELVGTEYVKSDGLMQTLLKGRLPDIFGKESEGIGGINATGNVQINIMPRAKDYSEWLAMKESTLSLRERTDAARIAGPVIDALAAPISAFDGLGL